MFFLGHAFEWSSAGLVLAVALVASAIRSRRTLRERQLEAVRWDSAYGEGRDGRTHSLDSLYL